MEKLYSYFDILFLVLIIIFLLFMFVRLLGKKVGLQRSDLNVENLENLNNNKAIEKINTLISNGEINQKKENKETFAEGSLNYKISKLKENIPDFNLKKFISGSRKAFEMIVTSLNKGKLNDVEPFLTNELYKVYFDYYEKNKPDENIKISIESFLIVDILNIEIINNEIYIKVKFLTRQKINNIIKEMNEIWTFTKLISENTNIWKLYKVEKA